MPLVLANQFNTASRLKKIDFDNDVNILMGGIGITPRITQHSELIQQRTFLEKKHKDFINYLLDITQREMLEKFKQAQKDVLIAINTINQIIKNADEQIQMIQDNLQNMTRRHRDLNDAIEARYFEKEENGNYKIKAIMDTLEAYKQRTGKNLPDDITLKMLILILKAQQNFEQSEIVPALENNLVQLDSFRNRVYDQKETLEEENERVKNALNAIHASTSLTDEGRRIRKAEILEQASTVALDAQMAAQDSEVEYEQLITELQEKSSLAKDVTYIEQSNNETIELNQSALEELQEIKPFFSPMP